MRKALVFAPILFVLTACFDVEADLRVTENHTLEGVLAFSMPPQAHDMFGADANFCAEPLVFTGEVYRCTDPLAFDFSGDDEPAVHGPFSVQRIGERTVRVLVMHEELKGDELPDDVTPEMIRGAFAGHAMIFRISGERIAEQQGGAVSDDGATVMWRLPMASLLLDDEFREMSAIIEY